MTLCPHCAEQYLSCFLCGEEFCPENLVRWYHADQDDLVCRDCAKGLEHTDTAYAGMSVLGGAQ